MKFGRVVGKGRGTYALKLDVPNVFVPYLTTDAMRALERSGGASPESSRYLSTPFQIHIMSDWSLTDRPLHNGASGIAAYAVLDALGLRLGYVTGWVKDPDRRVRMLKVAVRESSDTKEYLIPIGAVTLIDDARAQFHLRELTKRSLGKYCIAFDGELPEPRLLKSLIRYFPNPRPSVVERLEQPEEVPAPPPSRLTVRGDQGDGAPSSSTPNFEPTTTTWRRLGRLAPPVWTRLTHFSSDRTGDPLRRA